MDSRHQEDFKLDVLLVLLDQITFTLTLEFVNHVQQEESQLVIQLVILSLGKKSTLLSLFKFACFTDSIDTYCHPFSFSSINYALASITGTASNSCTSCNDAGHSSIGGTKVGCTDCTTTSNYVDVNGNCVLCATGGTATCSSSGNTLTW